MSAFIHTLAVKPKPGRLADARAEVARLAATAEANGAKARLLINQAGDTGLGLLVIEFENGEAWASMMQSDEVRAARRGRYEADYPMEVVNTSIFQEFDINPD